MVKFRWAVAHLDAEVPYAIFLVEMDEEFGAERQRRREAMLINRKD